MKPMKLKKYIELHAPFTSKEKVDGVMHLIQTRNTCLNNELIEMLCGLCNEETLPYLNEHINTYVENYKVRPGKPKPKKKTVSGKTIIQSNSSREYYQKYYPDSLAAKGYDYGLSDW
jgi:hypothetical protein